MRCSSYAVRVATAMCDGNFEEALKLAVGRPRSPTGEEPPEPEWRRDLPNVEVTPAEIAEQERLEEARDVRIDQNPLTTVAWAVMDLTVALLEAHRDLLHQHATGELADAMQVVSWDACLVGAKIHRALDGRDRASHGEELDDDPIQNDWNGSAKVALISIARSAAACEVIARATGDANAARIAEELVNLGHHVEHEFPNAWRFVRPGFDAAPPRKRRRERR
jgi:hypothetical protein